MPENFTKSIARREAASRGGKAKTVAKLNALARAQERRRLKAAQRRASLKVPAPFTSAIDFLKTCGELVKALSPGHQADLAKECQVNSKTVSRWMSGQAVPDQSKMDIVVAWWRGLRTRLEHGEELPPTDVPRKVLTDRQAMGASLNRLDPAVSKRLRKAAALRNLSPIQLAEQILDRHLPAIHELER
jgi:hypothetical protein